MIGKNAGDGGNNAVSGLGPQCGLLAIRKDKWYNITVKAKGTMQ